VTERKTLNDQQFLKLELLTEQIKPLPANVVPSEAFQRQMKLRLLDLGAEGKGEGSFRAA